MTMALVLSLLSVRGRLLLVIILLRLKLRILTFRGEMEIPAGWISVSYAYLLELMVEQSRSLTYSNYHVYRLEPVSNQSRTSPLLE
ncbi:hypothetical protein BDP27DRAFT_1329701, partial [Rhodocollybia butyracea]